MEISFLSAFGLSMALWAAPGAVTTEALHRAFIRGVYPVLLILVGSLVGDALWAIATFFGAAFLAQDNVVRLLLGFVESLILLGLAWQTLKDAWGKNTLNVRKRICHGDFVTGALLSLASPFTVTFWLAVNETMSSTHGSTTRGFFIFLFFVSFLLAALLWGLFLSGLVTFGRRFACQIFFRWLNLCCSLALGYFGLSLLGSTLHLLQSSGLVG